MSQSRQLAAIMFTDIVGYTALMGDDEKKALEMLDKNRAIQRPVIEQYNGRWIKELGDGVMSSFNTASDALMAAIRIQEACRATNAFQLRIGIHLGEVVFENDDVFGDGVNIASRIESLGIPGTILMSKAIRDQVRNNSDFILTSLGSFDFKNVSEPVEVFALANAGFVVPKREEMQGKLKQTQKKSGVMKWIAAAILIVASAFAIWFFNGPKKSLESDIEKSIAVLAFVDMSPAKDQEYFSDGLSEDLIDQFAKVPSLKVSGRTSSFSFKGKNEDLRSIGKALNVAYVLEGSVQKDGDNLRITAQLIRTLDGIHVWSDQYDRKLKDIFSIQDEISQAILGEIKIKLLGSDKEAVLKKYTDNIDAYQLYLQGRYWFNQFGPDAFTKAIDYFQAAIKLDPNYALAYACMSYCYLDSWTMFRFPKEQSLVPAIAAAQKALALDDQLAESHIAVGRIKFWYEWDFAQAGIELQKAIGISPNNVEGNNQLGAWNMLMGNYSEGHKYIEKAVSLDPLSVTLLLYSGSRYAWEGDYQKIEYYGTRLKALNSPVSIFYGNIFIAWGHLGLGKYKEAIAECQPLLMVGENNSVLSLLGSAYALNGEPSKALEVLEKLKKITGAQDCPNHQIAQVYASLHEWDQFNQYYQKAIELGEHRVLFLKSDIRHYFPEKLQDPEIQKLIQKIGLP